MVTTLLVGLYNRGYIGIMEKKLEATLVLGLCRGYLSWSIFRNTRWRPLTRRREVQSVHCG